MQLQAFDSTNLITVVSIYFALQYPAIKTLANILASQTFQAYEYSWNPISSSKYTGQNQQKYLTSNSAAILDLLPTRIIRINQ